MNCVRCNRPLEANARFCRNCGLPVANPASTPETNENGGSGMASPSPLYQPISSNTEAPTVPPTPWQAPATPHPPQQQLYLSGQPGRPAPAPPTAPQQVQQWQQQQNQQQAWRSAPPQSPPFAQPDQLHDAGTMRSGPPNQSQKRRKRRGRGLLIGLAIFLVLIVVLLVGVRFILHAYALNKMNQAFSDTINNIPAAVALLPDGDQTFTESQINAALTQGLTSSLIQDVTVHFTPNDVEVNFNVFVFPSTITMVPKIVNGQLVATNVSVQGIVGLILSPDDITNLVNTQITNLETHVQHTITAVTLENQAIVLHFKRSISLPVTPPPLPTNPPTLPTGAPTGLPTLPPPP